MSAMLRRDPGLPMHVFGTKRAGLARYGHKVVSADSLAWSYQDVAGVNEMLVLDRVGSCGASHRSGWFDSAAFTAPQRRRS